MSLFNLWLAAAHGSFGTMTHFRLPFVSVSFSPDRVHHDFIPHQIERQCGPRILTFFIYLSDVEKGGGTNFPQLDITVMPKKGSALLWPSVYDSDPMKKDNRFLHQALPVEEGVKYAVNGWIHMYDYLTAQLKGCN